MKKVKDGLMTLGLLFNIIEEKSETLNLWKSRQAEIEKRKEAERLKGQLEIPRILKNLKNDISNPERYKSIIDIQDALILNVTYDIGVLKDIDLHGYTFVYVELNKKNVDKIEQAIIKYNKENKENRI